jgi:hypothetical protein
MTPKFALLAVFIFFSFFIDAQSSLTRVKGVVKDASSLEPLSFVNVVFKGTTIGTTSDVNGKFELEIQKPIDTLALSLLGYKTQLLPLKQGKLNEFKIALVPANYELGEVTIRPSENPAHRIMREVIAHKELNNSSNIEYYEYEAYNKIQFDLNNFKEGFREKKLFRPFNFVFEHTDTTEDGKSFLPAAIAETMADVYYSKQAGKKQEVIKASQISGLKNKSVAQFLGDMYQNINVYENFLLIFNKSFVSPVTDNFLRYYKYYLVDSVYIEGDRCYKLLFLPKRKQDLTFTGHMYIHDTTWAIRQMNIRFNDNANMNYIKEFEVSQEYQRVDGIHWMLVKEKSFADLSPFEQSNNMGVFGRKTSIYSKFKINEPISTDVFERGNNVTVLDSADARNEAYWESQRPEKLSIKESYIYDMVDSLKKVKRFKNYRYTLQMLGTGYLHWKKFDLGQYYTFFSWNDIEGNRLKFGGVTSNEFSTRLELRGSVAYGMRDERFKYYMGFRYFLDKTKKKRGLLTMHYKSDLEQLSLSQSTLQLDNILTSMLRRTALRLVTNVNEYRVAVEYEWFPGFLNKLTFFNRNLVPLGSFSFERTGMQGLQSIDELSTTEIVLRTRISWDEKYLKGEFDRVSVGTRYPVITLDVGVGLPNIMGSTFNYQKARLSVYDRFRINPLGYTDYTLELGKIWGAAPYLFTEIHQGSQTYALDPRAFNMMGIFEFASDRFAYLFIDHHFEGFFLNKVPLMRRLKWRELLTFKSVIGDMSERNLAELNYPDGLDPRLRTPYLEAGVGVENILKILRVDFLWRTTHLDRPGAQRFGIRFSVAVRF